jgi:hypothetical protein
MYLYKTSTTYAVSVAVRCVGRYPQWRYKMPQEQPFEQWQKPRSGHYKPHGINPRINLPYFYSNNVTMSFYLY